MQDSLGQNRCNSHPPLQNNCPVWTFNIKKRRKAKKLCFTTFSYRCPMKVFMWFPHPWANNHWKWKAKWKNYGSINLVSSCQDQRHHETSLLLNLLTLLNFKVIICSGCLWQSQLMSVVWAQFLILSSSYSIPQRHTSGGVRGENEENINKGKMIFRMRQCWNQKATDQNSQ